MRPVVDGTVGEGSRPVVVSDGAYSWREVILRTSLNLLAVFVFLTEAGSAGALARRFAEVRAVVGTIVL
jgi:hypothetical protein